MSRSGTKPPVNPETSRNPTLDVGYYFDQAVFETSISLQEMRASTHECLRELERLGVAIDQATGEARITAPAATKSDPGE